MIFFEEFAAPRQAAAVPAQHQAAGWPQSLHAVHLAHQKWIERLAILLESRLPRAGASFVVDDVDVLILVVFGEAQKWCGWRAALAIRTNVVLTNRFSA